MQRESGPLPPAEPPLSDKELEDMETLELELEEELSSFNAATGLFASRQRVDYARVRDGCLPLGLYPPPTTWPFCGEAKNPSCKGWERGDPAGEGFPS